METVSSDLDYYSKFVEYVDMQQNQQLQKNLNEQQLNNLELERAHQRQKIQEYNNYLKAQQNHDLLKKNRYSAQQKVDEVIKLKEKNLIQQNQVELKTQIIYQAIANDEIKNENSHQDLPQYFQAILENLKLLFQRTKGQAISVNKIVDQKVENLRLKHFVKDDKVLERNYIFTLNDEQQKMEQILLEQASSEKFEKYKKTYNSLPDEKKEQLANFVQQQQKQKASSDNDENDIILQKLFILEINRCFYNDQYISKVCYFCDILNRLISGQYNFIEILQIDDDLTPLILHPVVVSVKLYFEELLDELKPNDQNKKIYSKPSSLPVIVFINLDGFDNPLNLEAVKNFPSFNYFSIFHEFFNPDGVFSFYKYLKQNKEVLKSFFPFFTPYFKHVEEYYTEKGKIRNQLIKQSQLVFEENLINLLEQLRINWFYFIQKAKRKKCSNNQAEEKIKERLDSLYKGVISDEEFAFLFEEYIVFRLNDYSKVDALVLSYTCVMSSENKRTEQMFRLSEQTFFNIFTHIVRRTNFRMIFLPRLIIRNLTSESQLPKKYVQPYYLMSQKQQIEQEKLLDSCKTSFQRAQLELKIYEQQIRDAFGIYQFQQIKDKKASYVYENYELVKYVQNITCGFFQFLNSLNFLKQKPNTSIFTQKKDILHWRFVQSTIYMQNRIQEMKNKDTVKNILRTVKKDNSYFIQYLKEKEKQAIENLSNQESLYFIREFQRALELADSIFLFQHNDKFTKTKFTSCIQEDQISVKKFRIINSLNKSCFMTKYSQYYVDYKNQMVFFFNILFPADQSTPKQYDDLVFTIANCVGQIPSKDSLEDDIQVQKICDWKFSRLTLGLYDEMQKDRQYFLQDSTIIKTTKKFSNLEKHQFLLFFGGQINYFDKNKKEINLQKENFIQSTCLYCLKIGQQSMNKSSETYFFEEIKIFGIPEHFIQNLSYSSGAAIKYFQPKENVNDSSKQAQQQDKQKQQIASTDKSNKQQLTKLKEPSNNKDDYEQQNYIFIFGGEYNSNQEQCTLQNVILFSNIEKVLLEIIQNQKREQETTNQLQGGYHQVQMREFKKIKYVEQNEERLLRENTYLLEQIDIKLGVQQKDYLKKVKLYLLDVNKQIQNLIKTENEFRNEVQEEQEQFVQRIKAYFGKQKLDTEQMHLIYQKALCHKILGQFAIAFSLFSLEGLIIQLCLFDKTNISYFISHLQVTSNMEFDDTNLEPIVKSCLESINYSKDSDKQFLQMEIKFNQCKYLYKTEKSKSENLLDAYIKMLKTYDDQQIYDSPLVGSKYSIYQKLADAYQIYYKCASLNQSEQNQNLHEYYIKSLEYSEKIRTIPQYFRQNKAYIIDFVQVPKYQLIHLDSIKSINKRKAFKIKPEADNQLIQKLDTKILLIGGTYSKYQNFSDSVKIENAHFFYPVLYLNYFNQRQNNQKVEIRPENGFIQRIDLNQQFCPQQIASLNHNYIIQNQHIYTKELKVIDSKKPQVSQSQSNISQSEETNSKVLQSTSANQSSVTDSNIFKLDQVKLEIRIIECEIIDSKSYFLNKKQDDILDENQNLIKFDQTYNYIKDSEDLKEQQNNDKNSKTSKKTEDSEQQIVQELLETPAVYESKDDRIEIDKQVQRGSKLNRLQIQEHQQNQAQYIQKMQNNIYVGQDQRLYGCFYTSMSFIFDSIFLKPDAKFYQNKREKPKTKSFFWEIMKQLNKKIVNPPPPPALPEREKILPTLTSLEYEQPYTKIVFLQQQAKCLLQGGLDKFSKWCLFNQPSHQNETDIYMNIFWRQGSTKLIMYDLEIQRIIQLQIMVYNKKKDKFFIPNDNQIRYVFFNNKDQHIYLCIEEEFQYKFQNVLMRAPLQSIKSQFTQIEFKEQICEYDPQYNKIAFTINSKNKILGILQENLFEEQLPNMDLELDSSNQQKWILENKTLGKLSQQFILRSFETVQNQQISHLEYVSNYSQNQIELFQLPLKLAILGRQVDLQEIKKLEKKIKELSRFIDEKLKNVNQDQNDKEKAQFQCISTLLVKENKGFNDAIFSFLCNISVYSLIKQSFSSLILGHSISANSLDDFSQLRYRITYLDISQVTNMFEVFNSFIDYFQKKGQYLKYLNISGQSKLLTAMIDKDISFTYLTYIDISNTELYNKQQLIKYIQALLNRCSHLQGINIYSMKFENDPTKSLVCFKDLQEQTFTSSYSNDYALQVYIEKEKSLEFQQNEDNLIKYLSSQFGPNYKFIDENKRQFQKLFIKSKSTYEIDYKSDKIDRLIQNFGVFKDPIVFSTETKYLIFERVTQLIEEKKYFIMKFYNVLQSDQKMPLENIKQNEIINVQFNSMLFTKLFILNISKLLNDEGEKFTIFGIMLDKNDKAYICKICLPVPTGSEISQEKIKFYKSRSNIKKFSKQWMQDCFLPIYHNKKVKNTYLCVKDSYQLEGYSFFSADELIQLD